MTTPNYSTGPGQDAIQFDQAEFSAESGAVQDHGTRCSACAAAIPDVYFEAGGKIVCSPCRDRIEALFHRGSRLGRALKALVFGTVGAAIGAVLYYAIMQITGMNIGLVAIVVGLLVGGAVKAGSGNRGGRFYQFLALFLTYSAIAAMHIPDILESIQKMPNQDAPAQEAANADPKAAPAPLKQAEPEAGKKDQAPAAPPALQPAQAQQGWPGLGVVLLALGVLIGFAYSLPVLIAVQAPISGLIFGFALWEAWKINRKVGLAFNGPFRLATPHGDIPAIQPEESGDEP